MSVKIDINIGGGWLPIFLRDAIPHDTYLPCNEQGIFTKKFGYNIGLHYVISQKTAMCSVPEFLKVTTLEITSLKLTS
jgi:hypothetical protein